MIETLANAATLADRLRARISREGPIPFCEWMKVALYDPQYGYYCRADRNRWGREGDYRTSPERSRLFAATFARYFAQLYEQLDRPATWTILEAGAGDGRFAASLLQTLQKSFPNVFSATRYVVDEVSPHSGTLARARLQPFAERVQFCKLDDVEINPGVVFSNELLDAFPVHRITEQAGEFREFYVSVDEAGNFRWLLDVPDLELASRLESYFASLSAQPQAGQIVEVSLELESWLERVAARMAQGYLVSVDYGACAEDLYSPMSGNEGTLRGFQRHQFVDDLLAAPGEHDLTATVNWSQVKAAGLRLGLKVLEFERQDKFLLAAGCLEQLEAESLAAASEAEKLKLSTAARELILPDGMGAHFQVLVQQKQ